MNLRRLGRCELLVAGSLLLAGAAGCSGARTQTTAARPQPETRTGSGMSGPFRPDPNPGSVDEYPDFRGQRQGGPALRGPGLPPSPVPGAPGEDLAEPPPFPGVDEQNDGGPAASRSPGGMPRQTLAGSQRRQVGQSLAMPVSERRTAGSSGLSAATVTRTASRPGNDATAEAMYTPLYESRRQVAKPPAWSSRRLPGDDESGQEPQIFSSAPSFGTSESLANHEPVRMSDPPRLNSPPSGAPLSGSETELLQAPSEGLEIAKMLICRQVRSFDDVVECNTQGLRQGQPVLVYAALEKFLSIATGEGYRTQTLSSLEIQTLQGDVLLRIPLGTATDVADAPRQNFFLTHRVSIPANLPSGSYVLDLRVDDLQSRESARAQVHVTVTADRSLLDETAGTSKFATRPDSFLR